LIQKNLLPSDFNVEVEVGYRYQLPLTNAADELATEEDGGGAAATVLKIQAGIGVARSPNQASNGTKNMQGGNL
jgi:hypothetical protein